MEYKRKKSTETDMRIPFTLETWLSDKSQKVETETGQEVKILEYDRPGVCPIVFRVLRGKIRIGEVDVDTFFDYIGVARKDGVCFHPNSIEPLAGIRLFLRKCGVQDEKPGTPSERDNPK